MSLKGFKHFVLYNNIPANYVRMAANLIEYLHCPVETYLFKEEEKTAEFFYGIIKGEVAITKNRAIKKEIYDNSRSQERRLSLKR